MMLRISRKKSAQFIAIRTQPISIDSCAAQKGGKGDGTDTKMQTFFRENMKIAVTALTN